MESDKIVMVRFGFAMIVGRLNVNKVEECFEFIPSFNPQQQTLLITAIKLGTFIFDDILEYIELDRSSPYYERYISATSNIEIARPGMKGGVRIQ